MFIHLGKDYTVNMKNIVAIFDIENTSVSAITRDFLVSMSKNNRVIYVNDDLPKSFVLVKEKGNSYIYVSSLSSATLKKRSKENKESTAGFNLFSQKGMV